MRPDLALSDASFQRLKAEAKPSARVTHPNIVQVYALGKRACTMALEFVEGRISAVSLKEERRMRHSL